MKTHLQQLLNFSKAVMLGCVLMLSGFLTHAQVNYLKSDLTGLTYTQIPGGTVINTNAGLTAGVMSVNSDDGAVVVTLPFTFTYNGNPFTQVTFCTNGWIGMGSQTAVTAAESRAPGNLFTTAAPNNTIAAWFRDMGANFPLGTGSMVHGSVGTDMYAFEFRNACGVGFTDNGTTILINFKFVLYGPLSTNPGRIELLYGAVTGGTPTFATTLGLENAVGGTGNYLNALNGLTNSTATSTAWPGNGNGYRFDPYITCAGAPTAQPTALTSPTQTKNSVTLSFTHATPQPNGYTIVRYPTGATVTNPVSGTLYAAGQTLGAGTVVGNTTDLNTIVATGLISGNLYDFYAYSTSFCTPGGPLYNTTSPATLTQAPLPPSRMFTTATGGVWSATTTWSGGVLPDIFDTIEVASGATLTLDIATTCRWLEIKSGATMFMNTNLVDSSALIINTGGTLNTFFGTTGRQLTVCGDITNNGTFNAGMPGSILLLPGTLAQTISGTGTFSQVPTLTVNNGAGVTINSNITVPVALNLTKGVVSGTGTLTLGNLSFNQSFAMTSSGGRLTCPAVSGLAGMLAGNATFTYNAPTPAATITTGNEINISAPTIMNVTFNAISPGNYVLGSNLSANNITFNDTVDTDVNTLTVNGVATFNATANVIGTTFTMGPVATISTSNLAGITTASATGSVRTATRNYSAGGNYTYNGAAGQVTGDGLPITLTGGLVTISTTSGTALSQSTTFNDLTLTTNLLTNGFDATVNNIANFGTLQVSGTGGFISGPNSRLVLGNTNASGVIQNAPATVGNIINTGLRTFNAGTDIVINGSAVATGNGFPTTGVDSLVLNQTTVVVLTAATSVNTLNITSTGRMTTTAINTLTVLGTTAGSVARNNTGYIDGPLTRTFGVGATGSFMFPLGVGATGALGMEIINPVVTGSSVTLTAVVRSLSSGGTAGTGLTSLATNRYWAITPVSGGTLAAVGNIRVYETTLAALGTSKKLGMTTATAAGSYNSIGGQLDSGTITILSSQTVSAFGTASDSTYFVLGVGAASGAFTGGTYTVGPTGTYFSLTSAIAAINENTSMTAPVVLEFQASYNPAVETYPIVFRASLPTSVTNTITIRPAAAVSSVINFNGASFLSTALFDFNGGSNIIIDGRPGGTGTNRYIAINQQSIGAFPCVRFINDAQNNTLRHVVVSGQNTSTTSGLIVFSTGIAAGNSNNLIDNATINGMSNTANCIFASGSTAPADNKNVTISNSNIHDFFINGISCIGILVNTGNSAWTVNANNFYQTVVRNRFSTLPVTTATQFRAMNLNSSATNAVWTVTNNRIGGNIPGIPGSVFVIGDSATSLAHLIRPIDISNAGTLAPSSVQGNNVSNITLFTSGTDNFTGIGTLQAGIYNVGNITPNTVGSTTTNGSITIYNRGTSAITTRAYHFTGTGGGLFQNNIASGIDITVQGAQATGGTVTFQGITVGATFISTSNPLTISGNTFGSTTLANSFRGLPSTIGATGFYGMFISAATGAAVNVTNNTVSNITSFSQSAITTNSVRGINIASTSSIATTVSGNTITNLRCDAPNNASDVNTSVIGIVNTTSSTGIQTISNNTIHSLTSTFNGPVANVATGIFYNSTNTSGNSKVERNTIHSLETGSSNGFASQLGIFVGASATYVQVQNNFVRLGVNVNGTTNNANSSFYGIYKQNTNNTSIIYNSVYIAGSPANSDTLVTVAGFFKSASGASDTLMNNIFMNARSRTSGNGEYYAMYLNNTTGLKADANLYFANGTGGTLFRVGTTRMTTMQAWRAAQKPWEQRSAIGNPSFNAGITNSAATINFTLAAASPAARAGITLAHITVDQGGNARTATPAIGSYDVGLSALTASNDVYSPIFVFTKSGNRASANTSFNNVTVTDIGTGVPTAGATAPKLWYKNATTNSAWASVAPGSFTGTGNSATFAYNFNWASIGGTPAVNDKIYYYFVAQDGATSPNIWYSQYAAADPVHSTVSAQTTPPSMADSFLIVTPLVTTIGIPGTYPSLTGVGGFFEAVNNAALGGNTVVTIGADVNETGVNELKSDGMGGFMLTIQPDASLRTLWGNSTTSLIRLNGVSKVVIDGGAGRNLRFVDSIGTTPSGTVGAVIEFLGGCSSDTLVNCIIEGNSNTGTRGTVLFGNGTNTNIVIANNDIKGIDSLNRPLNAIFSNNVNNANIIIGGTAARPGGNTIYDFSNIGINFSACGDNIMIGNLTDAASGNQLYNRAAGSALTFVSLNVGNNHTIANNKVYQKSANYSSTVVGYNIAGSGSGHRVTRNHFGGAAADRSGPALVSTASNVTGISVTAGITSNTIIDSNYVSNFGNTGSSGVFGINLLGGNALIQKNIIGFGINPYDTIRNQFDNGLININGGNNVVIEDNKIGNAKYIRNAGDRTAGITVAASVATLLIKNNIVKDLSSDATSITTSTFGVKGIILSAVISGAIVEGNTVYNILNTNVGTGAYVVTGISINSTVANSIFRNNRIYNIGSVGTGTGTSAPTNYGIYFASGAANGNTVINNQISIGTMAMNEAIVQGIRDEATSGNNMYTNNSIFINGNTSAGANVSHGIFRSSTVNMVATNNLIYNKRTGGTGKNYALGSAGAAGVAGGNIQYNMMFTADTSILAELPSGIANGWAGLGTFYTTTYNTNWAEKTAAVLPELLFTDTLVGNLGIVTTNPEAWYVNGKGIRIIGQTGDFNNATGVRSGSITSGAVDIGSVEFTPSSTPPDAFADKAPANSDSTQFFFASRMIAKMNWGAAGTVPSTVTAKYYSGTNPANTGAPKTYMNAYWNITQTGGSGYNYALTLMQDSAVLGTVGAVANLGITRYTGTGTVWALAPGTVANNVTGFMSVNNRTAVGIYTGTDITTNTLPVKYTSFTAVTSGNDAVLDWTTATEINNKGFEIERSIDGVQFDYVDFVKGSGKSSDRSDYRFTDADAFTAANSNVLYYRLKQVDYDGAYTYSNIVRVIKDEEQLNTLSVYPNPYAADLMVTFTSVEGKGSIEILDITGKVVLTQSLVTKAGMNTYTVNKAAELQAGIYFARIEANGKTQMVKLVKN